MSEMGVAMMGIGAAAGQNRAREAAEKAINSPLLEDIDLAGAKGILVNITAGLNLTIGEFDEVGNTVRDFADEDATVVVGTVIDPEMEEELRVTVVATGLGRSKEDRLPQPQQEEPKVRLVANGGERPEALLPDYKELDSPTTIRQNRSAGRKFNEPVSESDMDYLDIPAFLRRQAD
jgi:cell division protein FtsZ